MTNNALPPDQQARLQALDTTRSFLVQAPAGSGKTDLLTRRFLALLATVNEPEEILAITFTRAATAEMRNRILSQIEAANLDPLNIPDETLRILAVAALDHSKKLNWRLLEQPQRLRIETIDSFCGSLARATPLLVRLGGSLTPSTNPDPLYSEAAHHLFAKLDQKSTPAEKDLSDALSQILLHRDNSLTDVESLLTAMLKSRDQWLHPILSSALSGEEWEMQIAHQQATMQREIVNAAATLRSELATIPGAEAQILSALDIAAKHKSEAAELPAPSVSATFPPLEAESAAALRELLVAINNLLLTDGKWRKQYDKRQGFPATVPDAKQAKNDLLILNTQLAEETNLLPLLQSINSVPPVRFNPEQTALLRSCFIVLKHLYVELRVLFAERNEVDFTEISHAALQVLQHTDAEEPSDLALALSDDLRHILVDEFQDTSRRQHELLRALMSNWSDDHSRTCFLVGDPMQSIYSFRQAEVELFSEVRDFGFLHQNEPILKPISLRLLANFRSAPALVHQLNDIFPTVFQSANSASSVEFVPAVPARKELAQKIPAQQENVRLHLHPTFLPEQDDLTTLEVNLDAQTQNIVQQLEAFQHKLDASADKTTRQRIAVLGRSRNDLLPIAKELRRKHIPYRGIEIVQLKECPEVLDLCSLLRALTNPADRIAWLAILRAPWCGLSLTSLHTLAATPIPPGSRPLQQPLPALLNINAALLPSDEQARLQPLLNAMEQALRLRYAQPDLKLGTWLERLWHSLGGPLCVDETAVANAALFFRMLDDLPNGEIDLNSERFDDALNALWAQPDPNASSERGIQLMTIHKSKGLEFESVVLVGLERKPGTDKGELIYWLERLSEGEDASHGDTEFLVAPVAGKGEAADPLVQWVKRVRAKRTAEERKRLLYVAATRAREHLYLYFKLKIKNGEIKSPDSHSLLNTAWSALEPEIQNQFAAWLTQRGQPQPQVLDSLAASSELQTGNLFTMPSTAPSSASALITRRLALADLPKSSHFNTQSNGASIAQTPAFERRAGGLESRLIGIAIHRLIEQATRTLTTADLNAAQSIVQHSHLREKLWFLAQGLDDKSSAIQATHAIESVSAMLNSPAGQWVLAPHNNAQSEVRWTRLHRGTIRTFQPDRVFLAGMALLTEGEDCWWIIDYKTSHPGNQSVEKFLSDEAEEHSEQLNLYAETLKMLEGEARPIRTALYFPLINQLHCL